MIEDPLSEDILRNKYAGKGLIRIGVETDPATDEKKFTFTPVEPEKRSEPALAAAGAETT